MDDRRVNYLLIYLVLNAAVDVATVVLSVYKWKMEIHKTSKSGKVLTAACVFVDADKLLQRLMEDKFDVQADIYGYNGLDIAIAFGSKRCERILQQTLTSTPNIYRKLSPFNFLPIIANDIPCSLEAIGADLFEKCARQGINVNDLDDFFEVSPLYVAVSRKHEFVKPLLEVGADVNCKYFEKTPIALSISLQRACEFDIIKALLHYNPIPEMTENALFTATHYDLHYSVPVNVISHQRITYKHTETDLEKVDIPATTREERFLATSVLALLYEFGFSAQDSCEEVVQQLIHKTHLHLNGINHNPHAYGKHYQPCLDKIAAYEAFLEYIRNVKAQPRSLQSACRISIRKAFPGQSLHELIRRKALPQPLIEYIVRPHILRKTVVEE